MQVQPFSIVPNRVQQNAFSDSDENANLPKKRKTKLTSPRRAKSTKRSKRSTAKSVAVNPKFSDDDDVFQNQQEGLRKEKLTSASKQSMPPKKKSRRLKKAKSKAQPKPPDSPKLSEDMDEPYVQVLQIPDVPFEETYHEQSPPQSPMEERANRRKRKGRDMNDQYPNFPSRFDGGDGMMPLETMAETTEIFTNAFRTDKYEGAVSRRKPAPEADLSQPVAGWLPFQVPIVPHPNDIEFEREATKQYDLTKLLHKAKSC